MRCRTSYCRRKEALTMDRPLLGNWNNDYALSTEINFSGNSHSLPSSADVSPSIFDNFRDVCPFPAQTIVPYDSSSTGAGTSTILSPSSSSQTSIRTAADPSFDQATSWTWWFGEHRQDAYTRQVNSTASPIGQPASPERQQFPYFKPGSTASPSGIGSQHSLDVIDVTKDSQPTGVHVLPSALLSTSTPLSPTQTSSMLTTFPASNSSLQTVSTAVSTQDSQQPANDLWKPYLQTPINSQVQSPVTPLLQSTDIRNSSGEDTGTYFLPPTTQPPKQTKPIVSMQTTDALDYSSKAEYSTKAKENHVCSQDVVFVTEVQKPELDKSTDILFVRENYNRSGVVCLTPNRKLRRKKAPYTKRVTLDGATTEFKVTISQKNDSSSAVAPTSVWNYLMASGIQTFDPKTTSLLEHLYHSGADSNSSITVTLPGTADTYEINMQTMQMKNTLNGEEIVLFRRPIVTDDSELPNSGLSEFPSHWSPQENDIQVVPIYSSFNSSEWNTIESAMRRTLPNLRIRTIERVQNKKLWIRYAFQKAMLMDKNGLGTDVNEKLLFHGTRENPPYKIWQSEDGFDMRYCKRGAWGLGTYFAQEASYSDNYAHRPILQSPLRQLVVASVLTGYSKDTLSDCTLRRPPVRIPATSRDPEVLYDSVTGISGNSRIYILYKFDMAYPSYLVSYSA